MALYQYECRATGETREIQASMAEPPTIEFTEGGKTWHRVWRTSAIVKGNGGTTYSTDKGKIPLSRSLPLDTRPGEVVTRWGQKVREHKDGTHSLLDGTRIVDSGEAMKKHCDQAGYTHHQ